MRIINFLKILNDCIDMAWDLSLSETSMVLGMGFDKKDEKKMMKYAMEITDLHRKTFLKKKKK